MKLFSIVGYLQVTISSLSIPAFHRIVVYHRARPVSSCRGVRILCAIVFLLIFLHPGSYCTAGQKYNPSGGMNPWSQSVRQSQADTAIDTYTVADYRAYCEHHQVNISCRGNEVITIASATFGDMKNTKCFDSSHIGYLNEDVKFEIERECSGKRHCSFAVLKMKKDHNWCHRYPLRCLLDLDFRCLPVNDPSKCDGKVILNSPGTLASIGTTSYSSDSALEDMSATKISCPWIIRVPSNHWINLTLEDFTSRRVERCVEYGSVTEMVPSGVKSLTICGGNQGVVWNNVSETNAVNVTLNLAAVSSQRFLIHYSVVGCGPIIPTRNAWVEILDRFNVIIHCNTSYDHWQLKCVGVNWISDSNDNRTCTVPPSDGNPISSDQSNNGNSSQVWMLLVMGVAIGIAVGVILLFLIMYFLRRKKKRGNFDCNPHPAVIADHTLKSCNHSCASLSNLDGPYSYNTCMSVNTPDAAFDHYNAWTWHQQRPNLNPYSTVDGANDIYNYPTTMLRPNDSINSASGYRPAQFHPYHAARPLQQMHPYTPTRNVPFQYPMGPYHSPQVDRRVAHVQAQNSFRDVQDRNLPFVPTFVPTSLPPSASVSRSAEPANMNPTNESEAAQPQTPTTPLYFQLDPTLTREEAEAE